VSDLITSAEFAQLARTADSTIRYWRSHGYGPQGFRLGRKVLYRRVEVEQWIAERYTAASDGAA